MGFDVTTNVHIREKLAASRAAGTMTCPRCGATNPATTSRCRSCLTVLSSKAPTTSAPRIASPIVNARGGVDAVWGELEALTREEGEAPPQFQCPECGRLVDEAATRCGCGALFQDSPSPVGYACPLCGARVSADATACRCGARFSD